MKAMIIPKFGNADVFESKDIETPGKIGSNQALVKIKASGTNPVDAKLRANGSWANLNPPVVLGYDASGVIEKIGENVSDFNKGDEVYYTPEIHGNQLGTYAEFNIVDATIISKKPKGISFEEASAIPLAGGTAWEAVIRRISIRPGESILIHGAAGGVGSFAVQFAKAAGAVVIATASPKNHNLLKELGADLILDYHSEDVNRAALDFTDGKGVDAAFDIQGENIISRCLPVIKPFGRAASILPPKGDLTILYRNNITLYGVFLTRESKRLEEMKPLFERKLVKPIIDQVLPLYEVSKAHKRLDSGHGRGKIVLKI